MPRHPASPGDLYRNSNPIDLFGRLNDDAMESLFIVLLTVLKDQRQTDILSYVNTLNLLGIPVTF